MSKQDTSDSDYKRVKELSSISTKEETPRHGDEKE